jgi:multimeric flavodoxin WrbA
MVDMKKVLAIMGSPRKNKNTEIALNSFLKNMDKDKFEITKIFLKDMDISPCTGCDYCGHVVGCVQKDEMDKVYEKFDNSDIIILAAPLYFNSVNGLTKNMIDRCQKYWSLKYSHGQDYKRNQGRIGVFISVGGAPYTHDQFQGTLPVMDFFFKSINADYKVNYFISNTDRNPVKQRTIVNKELEELGRNILNSDYLTIHR